MTSEVPRSATSSIILAAGALDNLPDPRVTRDQRRHQKKVEEAIKGDLARIVGNEDIITSDGSRTIRVPVRTLTLPRIVFDHGEERVGQGTGDSGKGKVVGNRPQKGDTSGRRAGDQPGVDYYEAGITIDDLAALVFKDLGLPNLEDRGKKDVVSQEVKWNDIRRKGPMGNLDKRRTILENMRRNAREGKARFEGIIQDDLRFRVWDEEIKPETQAVIIAMRDVSGSMGEFEKYITRATYFWMFRFLRTKYRNVEMRFITHHTEAKEVDEKAFFELGESGGTRVSSAYQLCLDIVQRDYPPEDWNVYPFHFSDGDNWGDVDNERCIDLIKKGLPLYNMWGYAEIQEHRRQTYSTTLMKAMEKLKDDPKVVATVINSKEGVYPAIQTFFPGEKKLTKAG